MTSEKEHNGFIKVYSGKKKGFVPIDILENIWFQHPTLPFVGKACLPHLTLCQPRWAILQMFRENVRKLQLQEEKDI